MNRSREKRPCAEASVPGHDASWAAVDAELEVRERLVAIVDALDAGNADEGAINVRLLLSDLDEVAA